MYEMRKEMQDIIGDAKKLPRSIRKIFWSKKISHWNRLRLASAIWINGLNPQVFSELAFQTRIFSPASEYHLHSHTCFEYLDEGKMKWILI